MYRAYFYKLFRSSYFYAGILGVIAVCSLRLVPSAFKGMDVLMEMKIMRGLDGFRKIFVILAALPFAANFSDEWNSLSAINCVSRTGVRKYAVSNVVMCYISALFTVFVGMMIFGGVYSAFYPLYFPTNNPSGSPYGIITEMGFPAVELAAENFVYAASCAMWSVMGLMLSAFFPSKYIALCSPFVFCYALEKLTDIFGDFNFWSVSLSYSELDALPAFLSANAIFGGAAVICGIIFTFAVERRVRNGSD